MQPVRPLFALILPALLFACDPDEGGDDTSGDDTADDTADDSGDTGSDSGDTDSGDTGDTDSGDTGDTGTSTANVPAADGWFLTNKDSVETSDTCSAVTAFLPSFELFFDGTTWSATSVSVDVTGFSTVDFPEVDYTCSTTTGSLVCVGSATLAGSPSTITVTSPDWDAATPTVTFSASVNGTSPCTIALSGTYTPWDEPQVADCPAGTITAPVTTTDGALTAAVYTQKNEHAFATEFADVALVNVDFPSGSTALGTAPTTQSPTPRWASNIDTGERFVLRAVRDDGNHDVYAPTNFTGLSDNANNWVFPRMYLRSWFDRVLLYSGDGLWLPEFGLLEVEVLETAGSPWPNAAGATITIDGSFETAFATQFAADRTVTYPLTVGGTAGAETVTTITTSSSTFFNNVCPGMVHVKVENADGTDCVVAPDGGSLAGAGIDVAVRADEVSAVRFHCPAATGGGGAEEAR